MRRGMFPHLCRDLGVVGGDGSLAWWLMSLWDSQQSRRMHTRKSHMCAEQQETDPPDLSLAAAHTRARRGQVVARSAQRKMEKRERRSAISSR